MCKIDDNYLPIELFKDLTLNQLKGCEASKNINCLKESQACFQINSLRKWPNKDNADDAIIGKMNIIKLAFDSRNKPNKLIMKHFDELFPTNSDETNISIPIVNEVKMRKSINEAEMKSKVKELLLNTKWRSDTWKFIDSYDLRKPDLKTREITENDEELTVKFFVQFVVRLENLTQKRVKLTKKKNWVWEHRRNNFVRMSCIIVLQQHVEKFIWCSCPKTILTPAF